MDREQFVDDNRQAPLPACPGISRSSIRTGETVLFAGSTRDKAELEAVAQEARRGWPRSQILIRSPLGLVQNVAW